MTSGTAAGARRPPAGTTPGGRFDEWVEHRVRAAFLDVDGTTLATTGTPSPGVAAGWAALAGAGVSTGFATGRLPGGLVDLRAGLGGTGLDVVHNGAQVVEDGATVAAWPLPRRAAARIARWCLAHGAYAEFYVDDLFWVTDRRDAVRVTWQDISGPPQGLVTELDLDAVDITKATINAFAPLPLDDALGAVRGAGLCGELSSTPHLPGVPIVNVTRTGVDKGSGVAWAAGRLGVRPDELLVVGDGDNDVPAFRIAGTAVAMGQAPDRVAEAAHLVTGTFEQDGLATALRAALTTGR